MRNTLSPPPRPALAPSLPPPGTDEDSGVHPVGTAPTAAPRSGPKEKYADPASRERVIGSISTEPPPLQAPGPRLTPIDPIPASSRLRDARTDPAPASRGANDIARDLDLREITRPAPPSPKAIAQGTKRYPSVPVLHRPSARSSAPPTEEQEALDALLARMKAAFSAGSFDAARRCALEALRLQPGHRGATHYLDTCDRILEQAVMSRIGDLDRVPVVIMTDENIQWLALDHRAGFILSLMDGYTTLEELLDIAGMPHNDVLRIVGMLLDKGVISVR